MTKYTQRWVLSHGILYQYLAYNCFLYFVQTVVHEATWNRFVGWLHITLNRMCLLVASTHIIISYEWEGVIGINLLVYVYVEITIN